MHSRDTTQVAIETISAYYCSGLDAIQNAVPDADVRVGVAMGRDVVERVCAAAYPSCAWLDAPAIDALSYRLMGVCISQIYTREACAGPPAHLEGLRLVVRYIQATWDTLPAVFGIARPSIPGPLSLIANPAGERASR